MGIKGFTKTGNLGVIVLLYLAASMALLSSSALAATVTVGIAVANMVDDPFVQVGNTVMRDLGRGYDEEAIEYYIPLSAAASGTYGVGGVGESSDSGSGAANSLDMILAFAPVITGRAATIDIYFEDLDLEEANDPTGFFESVQVFDGTVPLTDPITNIDGVYPGVTVTGNSDTQQVLSLQIANVTNNPLYVVLVFGSRYDPGWTVSNTPEYLRAELSQVPVPAAVWLFGSALLCFFGLSRKKVS